MPRTQRDELPIGWFSEKTVWALTSGYGGIHFSMSYQTRNRLLSSVVAQRRQDRESAAVPARHPTSAIATVVAAARSRRCFRAMTDEHRRGRRELSIHSAPMDTASPILQFGIASGGSRTGCWRVRAGARQPELFVEREGYGRSFHLSLHTSGRWQLKVGREARVTWIRPGEFEPGYTRALTIIQPVAAIMEDGPPPEQAVLVSVRGDADPIEFSVFIERPGANIEDSWPGKNAHTTMVGRLKLAAGAGTCCVVAREQHLVPGNATFPRPSAGELQAMRETLRRGPLIVTLMGDLADGGIVLMDLRADDESVLAALTRATDL